MHGKENEEKTTDSDEWAPFFPKYLVLQRRVQPRQLLCNKARTLTRQKPDHAGDLCFFQWELARMQNAIPHARTAS